MNDEKKEKPQKEKVRGCATFDGQKFTFVPEKKGEAIQKNVVVHGKSKLYETAGAKKSSLVAHLVADANAADPAFEMTQSLKELYEQTGEPFPEVDVKDVNIINQDRMKIRVSKENKEVRIYLSMPLTKPEKMYKELHMIQAKLTSEFYLAEDVVKKLLSE